MAAAALHLSSGALEVRLGVSEALLSVLLGSVAATCVLSGQRRSVDGRAWWWIGAAFATSALGAASWAWAPELSEPGLLLYNLYYPLVLVGLAGLGGWWPAAGPERLRAVMDGGGVAMSGLALSWYAWSGVPTVGSVSTVVGDTTTLAAVALLLRDRRGVDASVRLLGIGLACLSLSDFAELATSSVPAAWASRLALDLGSVVVALAAAVPDAALLLDRHRVGDLLMRTLGQIPVAIGGVVFVVTAIEALRGGPSLPGLALASSALCVLTVARLVVEQRSLDQELIERSRQAEERVRAQRLEVLGQLAGIVAHDLNNVLTVVHACATELEAEPDAAIADDLKQASQRGAQLCARLVGVAGRASDRRRVDVGTLVADAAPLLARVVSHGVSLSVERDDGPCPAWVEPSGLEVALLNLAINARDAMP
ncbi:MAG: hypothetical protein KC621_27450, partial [Myxococcales bacterium]|nr:hypothetical protein [Myxococcales bacterium]